MGKSGKKWREGEIFQRDILALHIRKKYTGRKAEFSQLAQQYLGNVSEPIPYSSNDNRMPQRTGHQA